MIERIEIVILDFADGFILLVCCVSQNLIIFYLTASKWRLLRTILSNDINND